MSYVASCCWGSEDVPTAVALILMWCCVVLRGAEGGELAVAIVLPWRLLLLWIWWLLLLVMKWMLFVAAVCLLSTVCCLWQREA